MKYQSVLLGIPFFMILGCTSSKQEMSIEKMTNESEVKHISSVTVRQFDVPGISQAKGWYIVGDFSKIYRLNSRTPIWPASVRVQVYGHMNDQTNKMELYKDWTAPPNPPVEAGDFKYREDVQPVIVPFGYFVVVRSSRDGREFALSPDDHAEIDPYQARWTNISCSDAQLGAVKLHVDIPY